MREIELENKAIAWLSNASNQHMIRPKKFTPKEVAEAIGGAYTSLGRIADRVIRELNLRGTNIRYVAYGNKKYFELTQE